ncbi:MAG: 4-(cytidine 5'-diphospho)-2-C-methyl-D-erythritol kinase [Pseudomonadota bacterium]
MAADRSAGAREFAPAKVNLSLHVTGRRPDGYHLLDSLVVFPRVGDVLEAERARQLSLTIDGPFADGLEAGAGNLILRAAALLGPGQGAALRLTKQLPLSSGIGGGSADAAAALRLLCRLWGVAVPDRERLARLGADVPVCLASRSARMRGIGEDLTPLPALPPFWLVLANGGIPVPTGPVFAGLAGRQAPPMPEALPAFDSAEDLAAWLAHQRNDLEPPARALVPLIGEVLDALGATERCLLARMSGSGGTCFGLFAKEGAALAAAEALRQANPAWWVAAAPIAQPAD